MNPNLTFCGVFRNEAQKIRYVLDIASVICGKMVIAVQPSEDETMQICSEYPATILMRELESPEESKDDIMEQVKTPWTFWLDGDEFPSLDVIEYVQTFDPMTVAGHDAISLIRINYIDGLIIEGGQYDDRQYRLMRSDVRWKPEIQGRRIHIHPMVKNPKKIDKIIYHHRSLEKVERQTKRWNQLEESTRGACDEYVRKVKEELAWKKSK